MMIRFQLSLIRALHPAGRFAKGASRGKGKRAEIVWANCPEIDSMFQEKEWIMRGDYTLVDPYALVCYSWGVRGGFPMKDLIAYLAMAGTHDEATDGEENC